MKPIAWGGRISQIITEDLAEGSKFPFNFFTHIFLYINKVETHNIDTIAINITERGPVMCYNPDWLNSLSDRELRYILYHEILHLIVDTTNRSQAIYDKELYDVAADSIINNMIDKHIYNYTDRPEGLVKLLPQYDGELISEVYYSYLLNMFPETNRNSFSNNSNNNNNQRNNQQNNQGSNNNHSNNNSSQNSDSQEDSNSNAQNFGNNNSNSNKGNNTNQNSNSSNNQPNSNSNQNSNFNQNSEFKPRKSNLDNHDFNFKSDLSKEEQQELGIEDLNVLPQEAAAQVIDNIVQAVKNRGVCSGDSEAFLKELRKSRKNYIKDIVARVTDLLGKDKEKSYKRESKYNVEGLRGYVKRNSMINVILDVSGSMCGEFETALSVLFSRNIICNLIQADTEIKNINIIRNNSDLQNLKISGLGGTELQPAIDFISNNKKYNKLSTLIITDGYCDDLDVSKLKGNSLILSTEILPHVKGPHTSLLIDKTYK